MSKKKRPHESFQNRLAWCLQHGCLSVADLHVWFKRAYPTVALWAKKGVAPTGPRAAPAHEALTRLERAIRDGRGFPVPIELSAKDRPGYMVGLRDGVQGVSVARAAIKRVAVRKSKSPKRRIRK